MRFLGLLRGDEHSEAGAPPKKELMEKMGSLLRRLRKPACCSTPPGCSPPLGVRASASLPGRSP